MLADLGYPEKDLEKLAARQAKINTARRVRPQDLQRVAKGIDRVVKRLLARLGSITDEQERRRVAEVLLRVDGSLPEAHQALGHVRFGGRWALPIVEQQAARKAEIQSALQAVRKLSPKIQHGPSNHELILLVHGRPGTMVSFRGLEIHTGLPLAKAQRLISNVVRAMAFSRFLIDGSPIELPKQMRLRDVQLTGKPQYIKALRHDIAKRMVDADTARNGHEFSAYYRVDSTYVDYSAMENDAFASIFSVVSGLSYEHLHGQPRHPTLIVGHANWVLMAMTGAHLPGIGFTEEQNRRGTSADSKEDPLQMLFGAGLMGARSWLQHKVLQQEDPAWSRSFEDQVGKIDGIDLLKTTFVAEYLHYLGPIRSLLDRSGDGREKAMPGRIVSIEKGLGEKLPEFEERWRKWMRGVDNDAGSIRGRLRGESAGLSEEEQAVLRELERIRKQALGHEMLVGLPAVTLDRDLSHNAILHARYLNKNKDQLARWPDAHEEFTDRPGFTPEGGWAGNHSVIAPGVTTGKQAIDGWMGTFYHRLPLLDPGLLRVGWGLEGTTAVLDSGSMVRDLELPWAVTWPVDGMRKVARRFQPELPNPVPGADQGEWGYPITLQLGPRKGGGTPEITITLRKGARDGALVPGIVSSPQAPSNPLLAPDLAWCFIPAKHLAPNTWYHVTATFKDAGAQVLRWSFSTGK